MSSSTAPKVGDTITTYDQLKQLPDMSSWFSRATAPRKPPHPAR